MLQPLTERKEWKFFGVLPKADPGLAVAWWTALLLRRILPAAIAMGVLVGAVQRGDPLAGPLALAGTIFVLLQVLSPIHQAVSANLGDRTAPVTSTDSDNAPSTTVKSSRSVLPEVTATSSRSV